VELFDTTGGISGGGGDGGEGDGDNEVTYPDEDGVGDSLPLDVDACGDPDPFFWSTDGCSVNIGGEGDLDCPLGVSEVPHVPCEIPDVLGGGVGEVTVDVDCE
jgi:hypothetical protein